MVDWSRNTLSNKSNYIHLEYKLLLLQVFICLSFSLPALSSSYKDETFPLLLPSLLPLSSVTLSGSVYCVIALATERYLHLTRPQDSNKGSFFGYILPVLVFSLLYNAPKFFEFTTDYRINKKRLDILSQIAFNSSSCLKQNNLSRNLRNL